MRWIALALAALALCGCESSEQKSARLERTAKREAQRHARSAAAASSGLTIARPSRVVDVLAATALHSSEGTAAAVTLRNTSASTLRNVPIEIAVEDAHGANVYTNTAPGLATTLTTVPLLGAHATVTWVDDQVQASGTPASVRAKVGEGERVTAAVPRIAVQDAHLGEGVVEGHLANRSRVEQGEVLVYALARRAGRIVAAGRAVVRALGAGASEFFQAFLIGHAAGARLEVNAYPNTFG